MATNSNTRPAAARAFVRSLNILLKFARMYDFGHPRTVKQFETGWGELRTALGSGSENESGVLLGVSGDQLLLDGTPLESAAAEKSFAKMLSAAGIASIHFSPKVTQASLARFVRGFPTGTGAKPVQLAEQLKAALQGDPHIHVNEVCFVPADSAVAKSTIAAQLAARTLGLNSEKSDELFNDPERLLQLIIAAEGTQGSGSGAKVGGLGGNNGGEGDGSGGGYGNGGSGSGSGYGSGGSGSVRSDGGTGSGSGFGSGGSGDGSGYEAEGDGSARGVAGGPDAGEGLVPGGYGNGGTGSRSGNSGTGSGSGGGSGTGGGGNAGASGEGPESSRGGHRGGHGYYGGEPSEIVRGIPAGNGESSASADSLRVSGPVGTSSDSGTWNIVGGDGAGTPLEPDVAGFWFNKDGSKQFSGEGQTSGTRISGGAPVHGANFGSESRSSDFGTWNIVGGSEDGTPLDANVGGFWLNKENSNGAGTSRHQSVNGKEISGEPVYGTRSAGDIDSDTGNKSGMTSSQGSTGSAQHGTSRSTGSGHNISGQGHGGSRRGGGFGSSVSGSSGNVQTGQSGGGNRGGGVRNTGGQSWKVSEAGGAEPAEASRWGSATAGIRGSRPARSGGPGSMAVETGLMTLHEDELKGILQVLAQIARTSDASKDKIDPASFQSRLSTLPRRARFTVSQALSALAAQAPSETSDKPTLMKLAEHIAIRFALESYEKGDIEVNAVRQVLDEMSLELDGLRKILGVYEEKMARHGIETQSHVDLLAQQFWSQVGDEKKKAVLESSEAWCVPPLKVREYVEAMIERGDTEAAKSTLRNYANCITNKSQEQRRQTSMGLSDLAGLYAKTDERLLMDTIRKVGVQLAEERDSELQSQVGAAFVRLSQEAANKRMYPAIQRAVELVEYVETERPGLGNNLRPRIAIENRLPEFIEEALKAGNVPNGLADLLRRMPASASEHLAGRFSRSGFREDCDLLISMMEVLGPDGLHHLREQLRKGGPVEVTEAIGVLTRLDADLVVEVLPGRMSEWKRTTHDRVVRQISSSGGAERGRLLLTIFDSLDAVIRPLAIDEIGMSGEQGSDMRLLRLAEGDLPKDGTGYLRLKAIEALGRLRTSGAEVVLRKIAEARKAFRWANPSELRLVAAQAMEKIDPEWIRSFIPRSGLSVAELSIEPLDADPNSSAIRQRRYPRLRLEHAVSAMTTNLKENCRLDIPEMTLGGGIAICDQSLHPGSLVSMKLNTGQKPVKAQTIVRDANTQARAFEVVEIDLEERAKLRKLLVQLGNIQKQSTPKDRSRRGTRTIVTGQT
ncbi:MAG TPA: hypothetical protein VN861_16485 [Candidatus Acidoferrales bacterium]|nr:hypothetical protein [Candidatus Acidoferrales bacterium]